MYKQYIMKTYKRQDVVMASGQGSWLKDVKGQRYLDFVAGIAVNSLGHNPPELVEVIQKQADKLIHVSNLYWTKEQGDLARRLIELSSHSSVFFCNSGTEAVEGAIKTAKKYGHLIHPDKRKILCFQQSFHGRTMGALSVTGQPKYRTSFDTPENQVAYCTYNDLASVKAQISKNVCGIIVEPVQGEGGILPADSDFLKGLRALCDQYDSLLIFDEVQCGIGRTGTFFAYEQHQVVPDIVCMAKGLGGGLPVGAFMVTAKADVLTYGDHGSTFGGNPLVSAVAKHVVKKIASPDFLMEVQDKSDYLIKQLNRLKDKCPEIQDIRGQGLMLGMVMDQGVQPIIQKAFEHKLLVIGAGDKVIRIVPPLNVSYYELDLFVELMEQAIVECREQIQ